ncbi:unnamed protein product [Linum trigynum]|uniref:Reverse transcriptase domain-containing protein n=1 Tax=Linum trigynum TaxID=586398 RepID=A0AAV2CCN9_9ROSI
MDQFRDFVNSAGLLDVGFKGAPFTWSNRQGIATHILERLDRGLVSSNLLTTWPNLQVTHLSDLGSDHRILLLQLIPAAGKGKPRFHFDLRWAANTEAREIIAQVWQLNVSGTLQFQLFSLCKEARHQLVQWARLGTTNSARHIRELREAIQAERDTLQTDWDIITGLETQLSAAYLQEEAYWRQKSRTTWLQKGDSNTNYFHITTTQRRRHNLIEVLRDDHGQPHYEEPAKGNVSVSFFQQLFLSDGTSPGFLVQALGLPHKVTSSQNMFLSANVTREEIRAAAFSIGKGQAPGSDGLTGGFFQSYWDIVGESVCRAALSFFRTGRLLQNFNHTIITLIPKVVNADLMRQMRPISLCQVFYKIISKVLTSRLAVILPSVISDTQNGFIKGRDISDNILIAQEVMQYLKTKSQGRDRWMALKLDMEKAYDRVEWGFLFAVMEALGFNDHWMKWIKACVTTVSFTVLLNGNEHGYFRPQRGLRQGDPLSPLLFAIYTEAFSAMLTNAMESQHLHGLKIHRLAPTLSHLFFADDTYLFLRATSSECHNLLQLLHLYEEVSGQRVNLQKSSVCFSSNMSDQESVAMAALLGVTSIGSMEKYLGLPAQVQRSKVQTFRFVEDNLAVRIQSWRSKSLSLAAKEVVIKAVGSATPVYAMFSFRLPSTSCRRLNGQLSRYWWAGQDKDRGMHWISWPAVCVSKFHGGLGFRDFDLFNVAMLGKQAWKILQDPASLLARLYKARYHPSADFLNASAGSRPSWAWQGVLEGRALLKRGLRWQIGCGTAVRILDDPWLPSSPPSSPMLLPGVILQNQFVASLIHPLTRTWNSELIRASFEAESVQWILSIPLPSAPRPDKLIWHFSATGQYTVKTGYHLLSSGRHLEFDPLPPFLNQQFWKFLWNLPIPPKLKVFLWRVVRGFLPMRQILKGKSLCDTDTCLVCSAAVESISHCFFDCRIARGLWTLAGKEHIRAAMAVVNYDLAWSNLFFSMQLSKMDIAEVVFLVWRLWKGRCWSTYDYIQYLPGPLHRQFTNQVTEWKEATIDQHGQAASVRVPRSLPPQPSCPPGGILMRFDGATKKGVGGSVGFVGFNGDRAVICAYGKYYEGISDPFLLELLALRDAMVWSLHRGYSSVCFCGDSQLVIRRAMEDDVCHDRGGAVLEEVRVMKTSFAVVCFVFAPRSTNRAAHRVAQTALASVATQLVDYRIYISNAL